jgi:hypothetical protein
VSNQSSHAEIAQTPDGAANIEQFKPQPTADPRLRHELLDAYIEYTTDEGIAQWLREINQPTSGTIREQRERVRYHSKYPTMTVEEWPEQTRGYLDRLTRDQLQNLCRRLDLFPFDSRDISYRRIFRELGYREGWLQRTARNDARAITHDVIKAFVSWFPVLKDHEQEKLYYQGFRDEMTEVFGNDYVHEQHPIAHGSTLRVDFHIGHPAKGIGVELKLPKTNSDLQRLSGQLDQYKQAYADNFILVAFTPVLRDTPRLLVALRELTALKGVCLVEKSRFREDF